MTDGKVKPDAPANVSNHQSPRVLKPVTIREVAAAAGVSLMTVSNFMNGRMSAMSVQTSLRIKKEIARLGYRPQTTARNLRLAQYESVGVIVVDRQPAYLADPFVTQIVAGLSNGLSSNSYAALLEGIHPDSIRTSTLVRNIRSDALCVMLSGSPRQRSQCLEIFLGLGQPVVLFQERATVAATDLCVIRQDDFDGGRMLADEVIGRGGRHLVLLVPRLYWPAIGERARGVRAAIRRSRLAVKLRVVRTPDTDFSEIQKYLEEYIVREGMPDGVLAGNDQIGIAAMKLMASKGLRIPEDIMITGFNAFEFWKYTEPVLTTVRSPAYEMGARGAEEVLERLRHGAFRSPEIVYPVTMQRGGST